MLEVALGGNWSFKGEYLYMDLGSKTYATALITDDGDLPGANVANVDLKIHTVRIGLNYRFGGYGYGTYLILAALNSLQRAPLCCPAVRARTDATNSQIVNSIGIAAILGQSRDDPATANQQHHCSLCAG
jgi:hypothetical protein